MIVLMVLVRPGIIPFESGSLPGCSIQCFRIFWVHDQVDEAGLFIDIVYLFPGFPSIRRLINATLIVFCPFVPCRSHIYNIGIYRVDDDTRDGEGIFQSHMLPAFSAVLCFPYACTCVGRTKYIGFPCSSPDDLRIYRVDSDISDGCCTFMFEHRFKCDSFVYTFPYPAAGGPHPNRVIFTTWQNSFHVGTPA